MRGFWRREDRADWPEPRAEFLQSLSNEVRGARGRVRAGGLSLAFVVLLALAVIVPSAFAAGSGKPNLRGAVKAVVSAVQAESKSSLAPRNNGGKDDDDDDNGNGDDDDDDNGDDYDADCPNRHERQRALIRHQQQEWQELRAHQRNPHPGLSQSQLRRHFKAERRALRAHQEAEWKQFRRECRQRGHGDEDDR